MSADETDSPPAQKLKTLRCMELIWLTPHSLCYLGLCELQPAYNLFGLSLCFCFRSVKSYDPAYRTETMREHIGHASFMRHWELQSRDVKSRPVGGLPRNWYNDEWFRGLSSGAILCLSSERVKSAFLPWYVFCACFLVLSSVFPEFMGLGKTSVAPPMSLNSLISGLARGLLGGPLICFPDIFTTYPKICSVL